jgi:hypothetical protein
MDCEFENRCLNSSKCFRCNGQKLLKLPEEKVYKKHSKITKANKAKVGNTDNSWEDLEETIADQLNSVPTIAEARRSRGSGNTWFEKGDVLDQILNVECKERKGNMLQGGDKSISIKKSWLTKAEEEASMESRISALPFRLKNDDKVYIIMESCNIIELVNMCKAYIHDNEVKTKEIELLKKRLEENNKR